MYDTRWSVSPRKSKRENEVLRKRARAGGSSAKRAQSGLLGVVCITAIHAFPSGSANAGEPIDLKTSTPASWSDLANATLDAGGTSDGEFRGSLEFLLPIYSRPQSLLFAYPVVTTQDQGQRSYSLGLGFRHIFDKPHVMVGGNVFYDGSESTHNHYISQFGAGVEVISDWFEFRGNGYIPQTNGRAFDPKSNTSTSLQSSVLDSNVSFGAPFGSGYGVFQNATQQTTIKTTQTNTTYYYNRYETGMRGFDLEAGFLIPGVERYGDVRMFGGYYYFENEFGRNYSGAKARLEAQITDHVILDASWTQDQQVSSGNWFAGLRFTIPLGFGKDPEPTGRRGLYEGISAAIAGREPRKRNTLESQIDQNVIRTQGVHFTESGYIEDPSKRKTKTNSTLSTITSTATIQDTFTQVRSGSTVTTLTSGAIQDIVFVDIASTAGSTNGTFQNPFTNMLQAEQLAAARFAQTGRLQTIYVMARSGMTYADVLNFTTPGTQIALYDSSVTFLGVGGISFGGMTGVANWHVTNGPALTIGNLADFQFGGFNITADSGPALVVTNVPGNTFHFIGGTNLSSNAGPALSVSNSHVEGSVASLTSHNSATSGVIFDNVTGNFSAGTVTVTSPAMSGIDIKNSSVNFTAGTVSVSGSGGAGIALTNNSGLFQVTGATSITNRHSSGIALSGVSGATAFGDVIISAPNSGAGAAALSVKNSSGTASFGSLSIDNTGSGSAATGIALTNDSGLFQVTGATTISHPKGAGIAIQGAGNTEFGSVNITGRNAAGIDISGASGNLVFGSTVIGAPASGAATVGLSLQNFSGSANFASLSIDNNGSAAGVAGISLSNVSGSFTVSGGTVQNTTGAGLLATSVSGSVISADQTFTSNAGGGVDIEASSGSFAFTNTAITSAFGLAVKFNGSPGSASFGNLQIKQSAGAGVTAANSGQLTITGGFVDNAAADGVTSTNTNLSISGVTFGANGAITGNGVTVTQTDSVARTLSLTNSTIGNVGGRGVYLNNSGGALLTATISGNKITAAANAFEVSPGVGSHAINFSDNTLSSATGFGALIDGGGGGTTFITGFSGNTVTGAATGGIVIKSAIFDADANPGNGIQTVAGGNTTIGTTANRVQGNGLELDGPTGTLAFGTLNIADKNGTGLLVNTKTLGTIFTLGSTGGALDTIAGPAMNIDPLTASITLDSVTSTNSTSSGVILDTVSGTVRLTFVTASDALANGVLVQNSSAAFSAFSIIADNAGVAGIKLQSNTGSFSVSGEGFFGNTGGHIFGAGVNAVIVSNSSNVTLSSMNLGVAAAAAGSNGSIAVLVTGSDNFTLKNSVSHGGSGGAGVGDGGAGGSGGAGVYVTNSANFLLSGANVAGGFGGQGATGSVQGGAGGNGGAGVVVINSANATITNSSVFGGDALFHGGDGGMFGGNGGAGGAGVLILNTSGTSGGNASATIAGSNLTGGNGGLGGSGSVTHGVFGPGGSAFQVTKSGAGDQVVAFNGNTLVHPASTGAVFDGSAGTGTLFITSLSGNTVVSSFSGQGGIFVNTATFDANPSTVAIDSVAGGVTNIGSTAFRVQGDGLNLTAVTGNLNFTTLNIANNGGAGLLVNTRTAGTIFTLGSSGGTIDTTGGSAMNLDPLTANLAFDAVTSANSTTSGVILNTVSGTVNLGNVTSTNAAANGILVQNSSANVSTGTITVSSAGGDGIKLVNNTGSFTAGGLTTITNVGGDGINLKGLTANPTVSFSALTINGFGANSVGVDFAGADVTAGFGVTHIQNGGLGTGIDLSNTQNGRVISFATGSSISSVNIGVQLSSGHTTATTANAIFTFGDGSAVVPNGRNSSISAVTTVDAIGLNQASGTYNFADVIFTGAAGFPAAPGGAIFVSAAAVNGVGDGSFSNPYSVHDADAVATQNVMFAFLDGAYNFATLNGGSAFTLGANQAVTGLDNGNAVAFGTTQPANVIGNFGTLGGTATRQGGGSLSITNGAAGDVFDLLGSNTVTNITVSGSGGTLALIASSGSAGGFNNTGGITINGVSLSGLSAGASALGFTNLTGTVSVQGNNINLGSSVGALLSVSGGSATYTIAKGTLPGGATPGTLSGANLNIQNTAGGSVSLTDLSLTTSGSTAVLLSGNAATVTLTNATLVHGSGDEVFNIDGTAASTGKITVNGTSTINNAPGIAFAIGAGARDIDASAVSITNNNTAAGNVIGITGQTGGTISFGNVTNSGTTAASVITTIGQTGGTVNFGNVGITGYNKSTGTAVNLSGTGGTVAFSDLDITTTSGAGLNVGAITFAPGSSPTISAAGATALTMNGTTLSGGAATFASVSSTNAGAGNPGISLTNVTGASTFTTVAVSNSGPGIIFDHASSVTVNGGSVNGTTGNAIGFFDTAFSLSSVTIGATSTTFGDGVHVEMDDAVTRTSSITGLTTTMVAGNGINFSNFGAGSDTLTISNSTANSLSTGLRVLLTNGGNINAAVSNSNFTGVLMDGSGITVTNFLNNQSLTAGMDFKQVAFNANPGGAVQQVAGGNSTLGGGLNLFNVSGSLGYGNLNITSTTSTGLSITTLSSFAFGNTGGSINSTNAGAISINTVALNSTFSSVTSTNAFLYGIDLTSVTGTLSLGTVNVTGASAAGLHMIGSSAAVSAGAVTIGTAPAGMIFGSNIGGSFTATGATSITGATTTGIDLNGAHGTYQFAGLTIGLSGAARGIDLRNSNVGLTTGTLSITGDGTAGSIGLDLSGSLNPNGANSTTANLLLANGAGQTASISNVATGVKLGDVGFSAGAYLKYGNQTPTASGGSGSSIAVIAGGVTIDTTNLTSTDGFTQGRYEFTGVSFTGNASFQNTTASLFFVASTATGTGDGSSVNNRANAATLLSALGGNTLANKTIVLINDGSAITITNTANLDANTTISGFGNSNSIAAFTIPVNVIIDAFTGTIADPTGNGAATLTTAAGHNVIGLNGTNSIQNVTISGGNFLIGGSGITGLTVEGTILTSGASGVFSFTNPTGVNSITNNTISGGGSLLTLSGGSAALSLTKGSGNIANTGGSGINISGTTGGIVTLTGLSVTGATATPLTFNNNKATFSITGSTFAVNSGVTLLNVDATAASTTALTFNNTNTLTQSSGTIATIGAGARNIDLSALNFANSGTTAANVIKVAGQTGGTISFGNIGITGYNSAGGTAVSLAGTGGTVSFADLDIATTAGAGLNVGAITFAPGATPTISTVGGTALTMNGTTLSGGAATFTSVSAANTGAGNAGINLANVTGATTFTTVSISATGTGAVHASGIVLNNAGTTNILGGTIDQIATNGIDSTNTTLTATGLVIGDLAGKVGGGVSVVNNDGVARVITISNDSILSVGDAIKTTDGGHAGELSLVLNGNTLQTGLGGLALNIVGSGTNSTTVNSFNGVTVTGNGAGGGVLFNRVTFDAVTGGTIQQVAGGTANIGQSTGPRVEGIAGASVGALDFEGTAGDLAFATLNLYSDGGTGLVVNTKALGTTFALSNSGGVIAAANGVAMNLDPLAANMTFTSVSSVNSTGGGVILNGVGGSVALGAVSVTNSLGVGVSMVNSSAAVTAASVTVTTAATGLQFGANTGSFTVTGATSLTGITGTGINANGATGTYQFAGLTIGFSGAGRGIDLRNSNVGLSAGTLSITGNGTAGSIALDLSGSLNPNGANSTTANLLLANSAGQTASISNVATGVKLGDGTAGSAGAYLKYGNQTPIASGGSGSSIAVIAGGVTIDTSNLTSTNGFTKGRYEFTGVSFTGLATFETPNPNFIFVGSTSAGNDSGSNPGNRITVAQLLTLDATPSNLNGKMIVFVNDGSINFGATTLTLGTNTVVEGFGNGATISVSGGTQPVNVIGDNFHPGSGSFTDPNGAATLTANSGVNVITLSNGDTIQNININGGNNQIIGTNTAGFTLSGVVQTNAGASAISLTTPSGTIAMSGGSISGAAGPSFNVNGGAATITYSGPITNSAGHSVSIQNITGGSVTLSGKISDSGTGILVQNNTGGTVSFSGASDTLTTGANQAVTLATNTGATVNFSGGGLAITTTSGTGFGASGGGTVSVTGTGNTISSTTGTALSLNGIALAGAGATFQSISANGAVNGIALSGVTGGGGIGVFVTGVGATAASGGTIQNTTGAAISLTNLASLTNGFTVNDMNITGGGGIVGTTFGTLRIGGISVSATNAAALSLTTGTIVTGSTFGTLSSSGSATNGVLLSGVSGSFLANLGSITNATGAAWSVVGGTVSATYSGSITQGNSAALVSVSGGHTTGTLTFQTGTLSATTGTGLVFDNAGGTYNFNGTTTLNGGTAGVSITNGSAGTFSFSSGTSIGATISPGAVAFNESGGAANVTFNGTIRQTNAFNAVSISNETGGATTFGGAITANTTTANGINLTSNTGATINFTGGGLGITTSTGTGFNATGGGTISVSGAGNTISSTAGTALNLNGVAIGSGGLGFSSVSATPATGATGISLATLTGTGAVSLGTVNVTGTGTSTGLSMTGSGVAVTAGSVTVSGGGTGLQFGTNSGGSFTVSGATSLTGITGTGINANSATGTGTYSFQGVTIGFTGGGRGMDLRSSNLASFQTGSITITGDGTTAGSIAIDLSGSGYPGGQPVGTTSPNIRLATGAGQTAAISGVATGVKLGDGTVGSAGAYLRYGNQTSGSSIAVNSGGFTIDTTNLTTLSASQQGRYEFAGVTFTGKASFEGTNPNFIFVGSAAAGAANGSNPNNRISLATFLASDNTSVFLANKTVTFVNDGSINFGAATLNLGTNTVIDGFGNSATVTVSGGVQPANVIGTFTTSGGSFQDLVNGAATLTANAGVNVITLSNGDTVQNINITGGNNQIIGSGTAGFTLSGVAQTSAGASAISLTNATGTISMTGGSIGSSTGTGINVSGGSATISYSGTITNSAGHSVFVQNITGGSMTLSGTINDTGTGILVQNNTGGTITFSGASDTINTGANQAVTLSNNTGAAVNFSGGGLAITTTTAFGFGAVGGGTIGVTGTGNTIASTGGISLNLNGVAIGSSGFILQSVSANGSTGINLTTLTGGGTTGVQVTGTGSTAGSGGTIQNSPGAAVFLTSLGSLGGGVTLNNLTLSSDASGIAGVNFGTLATTGMSVAVTGGLALNLTTGTITAGSTFSTLSSSGSATNGVLLSGVGGGFTASAGTITNSTGAAWSVVGGTVSATYSGAISQANNAALVSISGGHSTGTITFNTGTLSATNGTGLVFDNADGTYNFNGTTTLNGGNAAITIQNGSSGTFAFASGTTVTNPTGTAFTANGSTAGVTFSGGLTKSGASAGLLVNITNESGGTITFQTGTLSSTSTAGTGINLNNADGTVNFNGTTTLNGGNAHVDINTGSGGTITFGSNAAITSPSGTAFNEGASTATVTYNGTITQNNAATSAVVINGETGGTTTFGGAITANTTTANAINLTGNNGATINFAGGSLVITTTTGTGFNATGTGPAVNGGTVTVSGTGNTISSGAGTALNVVNTGIGATGLTFQSMSTTTSSNNAGIVLDNTGSTGGLTVTGVGTTAASGGTIASKTGGDILTGTDAGGQTVSGSIGTGIFLRNTAGASFNDMQLNDFTNFAIYGSNVTGFNLSNSTINGANGTTGNSNREEASIRFDNLLTSATFTAATITNSNINGGAASNLYIANTSGTLNRLTMTGNTIGFVSGTTGVGGNNLDIQAYNSGTVLNVTFGGDLVGQGNTITGSFAALIETIANQNTTMDVVVRHNTFQNTQPSLISGGGEVDIRSGAASANTTLTFDLSHNTWTGPASGNSPAAAFFVSHDNDSGTMSGTINANIINGGANDKMGDGIFVRASGSGTSTVLISNNTISNFFNNGIALQNNSGSGVMNGTIIGNIITNNAAGHTASFAGIDLENGATASDTTKMNIQVGSTTIPAQQNSFVGVGGAIDIELSNFNAATTFDLFKAGSGSGTVVLIIQDDNTGSPSVDTTGGNGTFILTTTAPPLPPAVAP